MSEKQESCGFGTFLFGLLVGAAVVGIFAVGPLWFRWSYQREQVISKGFAYYHPRTAIFTWKESKTDESSGRDSAAGAEAGGRQSAP